MSSADYRESLRACLGRYAEALASLANRAAFPQTEIVRGYRQGIIARITQMHALYYARTSGFGQRFESVVAGGLAVFCEPSGEPSSATVWRIRGTRYGLRCKETRLSVPSPSTARTRARRSPICDGLSSMTGCVAVASGASCFPPLSPSWTRKASRGNPFVDF
jgi:hypothetical protein